MSGSSCEFILISGGNILAFYFDTASVLIEVVESVIKQAGIHRGITDSELAALIAVLSFNGVCSGVIKICEVDDMYIVAGILIFSEGSCAAGVYRFSGFVKNLKIKGTLAAAEESCTFSTACNISCLISHDRAAYFFTDNFVVIFVAGEIDK